MEDPIILRRELRGTINFLFIVTIVTIVIKGLFELFEKQINENLDIEISKIDRYILLIWLTIFIYTLIMLAIDYYDVGVFKPRETADQKGLIDEPAK